jgi:hypothetical protein
MWPRHNIHGTKITAQTAAQGPPHACCFAVSKPNHCSRIPKDLWSASRSVALRQTQGNVQHSSN